jgi:hypothetical protein
VEFGALFYVAVGAIVGCAATLTWQARPWRPRSGRCVAMGPGGKRCVRTDTTLCLVEDDGWFQTYDHLCAVHRGEARPAPDRSGR